jgi:hypothetical protein
MKQILLIILIALNINVFSQDISGCETIPLRTNEEIKNAEPCIKKLSTYALSQPMRGYNEEAHYARKVVLAWVESTPDYSFSLNKSIMKIFKDDNLTLFNVYVCCLANAALTKDKDFNKYALEIFVNYVTNPESKVSQSKTIEKLIKDWKNESIDKYLKE